MQFLTLDQAKLHCRIDTADGDADLTIKINAAEKEATEYLQRNVYATQAALDSATAGVSAALVSAKATYDAAVISTESITDAELSEAESENALSIYNRAKDAASRVRNGIVINDLIIAAMLLIVGRLNEVREDGESMPTAARDLLHHFKCYA